MRKDPFTIVLDYYERITIHKVFIFAKKNCELCKKVKGIFKDLKVDVGSVYLDSVKDGELLH